MSSPNLTVVSYNTHEALADPQRSEEVLRFVEKLNPDVGTLHSGYWMRSTESSPVRDEDSPVFEAFVKRLGNLGYNVACQGEKDTSPRPDKTGFVVLSAPNSVRETRLMRLQGKAIWQPYPS